MAPAPTDEDYRRLLRLPTGLRRFLRLSERQAKAAGLTPAQHQLLLAIRGHPDPRGPTLGDVAAYLLLRHHNAVGLVDRAEAAGLLVRRQDPDNLSIVRLRLTDEGSRQLEALSELHLEDPANPGVPDLPATHFLTNPKGSRTPVKHARLNAARYALERMVVDGIPVTPAPYTIVKTSSRSRSSTTPVTAESTRALGVLRWPRRNPEQGISVLLNNQSSAP